MLVNAQPQASLWSCFAFQFRVLIVLLNCAAPRPEFAAPLGRPVGASTGGRRLVRSTAKGGGPSADLAAVDASMNYSVRPFRDPDQRRPRYLPGARAPGSFDRGPSGRRLGPITLQHETCSGLAASPALLPIMTVVPAPAVMAPPWTVEAIRAPRTRRAPIPPAGRPTAPAVGPADPAHVLNGRRDAVRLDERRRQPAHRQRGSRSACEAKAADGQRGGQRQSYASLHVVFLLRHRNAQAGHGPETSVRTGSLACRC